MKIGQDFVDIQIFCRGLIAMGESVCRPTSGALIAELFPPTSRSIYIFFAASLGQYIFFRNVM